MTAPPALLWRVFPWDPAAPEGDRFSRAHAPERQGKGRFDLPGAPGGGLYLAETPEHAVAEMIQHYRGQELDDADLVVEGRPLALVSATLSGAIREAIVDLCDPVVLAELELGPDRIASRDRRVTQGIAAMIHANGHAGLRWWSALSGDWHTVVLFRDRLEPALAYGDPARLSTTHPAVSEAARAIGIRTADA